MEIRVVQGDPKMHGAWPHYCGAQGKYVGLFVGSSEYVAEIFCPWCGDVVSQRSANRRYERAIRPESYDGPVCAHGFPDAPCVEIAQKDSKAALELLFDYLREGRAAMLANRYGIASAVADWVRPCPHCRAQRARATLPLLRHELALLAKAVAEDMRAAQRRMRDLCEDRRGVLEAMAELDEAESSVRRDGSAELRGFIYLIGHAGAVKIGWSAKHPLNGGRLSGLQVGSPERLELLGLILAPFSRERELHERFSGHLIRGEWFTRHQEILSYFEQNGIAV